MLLKSKKKKKRATDIFPEQKILQRSAWPEDLQQSAPVDQIIFSNSSSSPVHTLYTPDIHPIHTLNIFCTHPLYTLNHCYPPHTRTRHTGQDKPCDPPRILHPKHIVYTTCTHPVFTLDTPCAHPVFTLNTTVHTLYTPWIHALHTLYTPYIQPSTRPLHTLHAPWMHSVYTLYTAICLEVSRLWGCYTHLRSALFL